MTVSFGASWPTIGLYANFSGSVWTDITEYVRRIDINRPASRETGRFAAGTMSVTLANRDARFTPANTSGPYTAAGVTQVLSDIKVRLEAVYSATTYNLFCGHVDDWADEFPSLGYDAVTVMTAVDPLAQLASWSGVAITTGVEELSGARFARILDAAGFPASQRSIGSGDEQMQAATMSGSALDLLNLVADSEGGVYWYDPLRSIDANMGGLVFESRSQLSWNTRSTVSQSTFSSAGIPFRELRTSSGREQLVRSAELTRVGATVASTSGSGTPRVQRTNLLNATAVGTKALADLIVAKGSQSNQYRVTSVTIDPIVSGAAMWPAALGRRIRDRVTVSATIPASSFALSRNVFIDGISHSIAPMQWSTTFQFASATAWDSIAVAPLDNGATFADGSKNAWPY